METSRVTIREAQVKDCDDIAKLIKELHDFDQMPDGPHIGAETLRKDGFGAQKRFSCFVADTGEHLVGYALYFFNYSTWEGVNVFLEDLYITPTYRCQGIGTKLWRAVARVAVDQKCTRMDWVCAGWNTNALKFYEAKEAVNLTSREEWNLFRLSGDTLKEFAKEFAK